MDGILLGLETALSTRGEAIVRLVDERAQSADAALEARTEAVRAAFAERADHLARLIHERIASLSGELDEKGRSVFGAIGGQPSGRSVGTFV